jgi:hypothetical protein
MVGMTLSLVSLSAVFSTLIGQERALAAQSAYVETQEVTRSVMDFMLRELRMAAYDPTNAALPTSPGPNCPGVKQGIDEATPTRIRFRQDLDGDGLLASAGENVTYELAGTDLRRIDPVGGTAVLASGLEAGTFALRYFNAGSPPVELLSGEPGGLTAGQRDCVAKVKVTLRAVRANPNPHNPLPLHSLATSLVAIRNRALGTI